MTDPTAPPRARRPARPRAHSRIPLLTVPGIGRLPGPDAVVRHTASVLRARARRSDPVGRSVELVLQAVHHESGRMARWLDRLAAATAPTPPPGRRATPRSAAGKRSPAAPAGKGSPRARRGATPAAPGPGSRRRTRVPVD